MPYRGHLKFLKITFLVELPKIRLRIPIRSVMVPPQVLVAVATYQQVQKFLKITVLEKVTKIRLHIPMWSVQVP